MKEGETVVLKKLGCAGWWYVRVLGKCHFPFLCYTCFIAGGGLDIMSVHKSSFFLKVSIRKFPRIH
jgi:hypothetical protein